MSLGTPTPFSKKKIVGRENLRICKVKSHSHTHFLSSTHTRTLTHALTHSLSLSLLYIHTHSLSLQAANRDVYPILDHLLSCLWPLLTQAEEDTDKKRNIAHSDKQKTITSSAYLWTCKTQNLLKCFNCNMTL